MQKLKFFLKKTVRSVIITLIMLSAVFLSIQLYVDMTADPYRVSAVSAPCCTAIIVPGASVYSDGTPSPILEERLKCAYNLYIENKSGKILVSGDHRTDDYDEVTAMKTYLTNLGVPEEDIWTDHAGLDTYDSMYRAKNIFNIQSLLISTQSFHIDRAVYIARKLGISAYGCPCETEKSYNTAAINLRESLAKVKAVIETELMKRNSKYIGVSVSIINEKGNNLCQTPKQTLCEFLINIKSNTTATATVTEKPLAAMLLPKR